MMDVQINVGAAEVDTIYSTDRDRAYQVVRNPPEVTIEMRSLTADEAREVLTRLKGMPGFPEWEVEREVERKLPPLSRDFPRRLDV